MSEEQSGPEETLAVQDEAVAKVPSKEETEGKSSPKKKAKPEAPNVSTSRKGGKMPILEQDARGWFNDSRSIEGLIGLPPTEQYDAKFAAPNKFFGIWDVAHLAHVQGAPLNQDEVHRLVVKDGPKTNCGLMPDVEFQPVKFLRINGFLLRLLENDRLADIPEEKLRYSGVFFPVQDPKDPVTKISLAACGSVWWNRQVRFQGKGKHPQTQVVLNVKAPLGILMMYNADKGDTSRWKSLQEKQAERREKGLRYSEHIILSQAHSPGLTRDICQREVQRSNPWRPDTVLSERIAAMFADR